MSDDDGRRMGADNRETGECPRPRHAPLSRSPTDLDDRLPQAQLIFATGGFSRMERRECTEDGVAGWPAATDVVRPPQGEKLVQRQLSVRWYAVTRRRGLRVGVSWGSQRVVANSRTIRCVDSS